jgi:cephalosporin-C deacetylase
VSFPPYPPSDFEPFWRETYAEAEEAVLDWDIGDQVHLNELGPGQMAAGVISRAHVITTFNFRGMDGSRLNGWIAKPLEFDGDLPAFLWLQPYGRESVLPNQYGTRPGFISLSFNYFGEGPFHREKYTPARGYFADGIEHPGTWRFRSMFQDAVLAVRLLRSMEGVDRDRIGSMGMSQGGGISIWLGAWCPILRSVCADMPFLGALHETLMGAIYRYPLKELQDWAGDDEEKRNQVLRTISYFDTLNQASFCSKPTLVSVGAKDPAVKAPQVQSIYEALPGPKKYIEYPGGHDWHPEMVEYNQAWLENTT